MYNLSANLTKKFEDARFKVSNFISAKSFENIIFTKSATEGINLIVEKFSEKFLNKGDEVIISYLEHFILELLVMVILKEILRLQNFLVNH